jgi:hypothetical protein
MTYAINATGWRAVLDDFDPSNLAPDETLVTELPQWLIDYVESLGV